MKLSARLRGLLLALTLMSGLVTIDARADIYGYIDEQGAGHFATEKLNPRYQLFMRGSATFDSSDFSLRSGQKPVVLDPGFTKTALYRYLSQHPALKKYEVLVNQAAKEFALEPALLKAVMAAESGFNPAAVSSKGAIGLMQIMPDTAERYGITGDTRKTVQEKLTDPRTNIRLGARYLRDLLHMFPFKQDLVIASYNAGEGAIKKYKNQIPPYPETRNYVQVVGQFYQIYKPALSQPEIAITNASDDEGNGRARIHMVIPGRRNMPDGSQSIID